MKKSFVIRKGDRMPKGEYLHGYALDERYYGPGALLVVVETDSKTTQEAENVD